MVFRVEPQLAQGLARGPASPSRRAWRARAIVDFGTRAARQGLTIAEAANVLAADGSGPQG